MNWNCCRLLTSSVPMVGSLPPNPSSRKHLFHHFIVFVFVFVLFCFVSDMQLFSRPISSRDNLLRGSSSLPLVHTCKSPSMRWEFWPFCPKMVCHLCPLWSQSTSTSWFLFSSLLFFTEASHEQILACDNLVELLKPIALNSSKFTKKMSQNALRVLVLLQLDQALFQDGSCMFFLLALLFIYWFITSSIFLWWSCSSPFNKPLLLGSSISNSKKSLSWTPKGQTRAPNLPPSLAWSHFSSTALISLRVCFSSF